MIACRCINEDDVATLLVPRGQASDSLNLSSAGCQSMANWSLFALGCGIDELLLGLNMHH